MFPAKLRDTTPQVKMTFPARAELCHHCPLQNHSPPTSTQPSACSAQLPSQSNQSLDTPATDMVECSQNLKPHPFRPTADNWWGIWEGRVLLPYKSGWVKGFWVWKVLWRVSRLVVERL